LSRVLQKFPFLVEAWYWLQIYWVSSDVKPEPVRLVMIPLQLLTILRPTGLPSRPCRHCADSSRGHCQCRPSSCSTAHPP
jgi:hypothetical protein